jgi:hypothetical protein
MVWKRQKAHVEPSHGREQFGVSSNPLPSPWLEQRSTNSYIRKNKKRPPCRVALRESKTSSLCRRRRSVATSTHTQYAHAL